MQFLFVTVLSTFCGLATVVASSPAKQEIFPAGANGIKLYRIPGIAVTTQGTVLAYCEARKDSSSDWGEIEIHLRRSLDGGHTWQPAQQIAHLGTRLEGNPHKPQGGEHEQTVNNPMAVVDRETQSIEFLYCVNYARCFSMRSTDDGLTWSPPIDITTAFEPFRKKYNWKCIATGPGHGIQLKIGRLLVPVWLAYGKIGDLDPSVTATIFSDDHGRTWQAGEVAVPNEGEFGNPSEAMVAEQSDGSVMLVARNVSRPNRKLVTISPDGSHSWSTPKFRGELTEPICMASIASYPSMPGTLIFSGPNSVARDESGNEIPARAAKGITCRFN